jgi:HEAT repeat protein
VGFVVGRIASGNPLMVWGRLFGLHSARRSDTAATSVRRLGWTGSRLAVGDLIERLDDPSLVVREEAALALGEIGDPEAVEPLLQALGSPTSHIQAAAARALGHLGDRRAVPGLLACLESPSEELAAAAARALGRIGSEAAIEPLTRAVRERDEPAVVASSVEALGAIGHFSALWELLPRLRSEADPTFKKQLALAVGDLMGSRGDFYRVLRREIDEPGLEFDRALGRLRRYARKTAPKRSAKSAFTDALFELAAAYEAARWERSIAALRNLATLAVAWEFGIRGELEECTEAVVTYDTSLAMTLWYLQLLAEPPTGEGAGPGFEDVFVILYTLSTRRPLARRRSADRSEGL